MDRIDRFFYALSARCRGTLALDACHIRARGQVCLAGEPPHGEVFVVSRCAHGGGEHLGVRFKGGKKVVPPKGYGAKVKVHDKAILVEAPDLNGWAKGLELSGDHLNNLHPLDVQFWYYNIQENVEKRLVKWFSQA